jgi:Mrp family chromosome partitioning ATPase
MIRVPPAPLLPTSTAQDVDADSAPPPRGTWSTPPPGASSPPFAPIRSLPAPLDPRLILLTEPSSARADSFRSLRDNLVANKLPRVLAVTSAAHREGKTTCAVNLALALSEQPAAKILFIDANAFDTAAARMFAIDVSTRPAPSMDAPFLMPFRVADVTRAFHVAALVRQRGEPPPRFDAQWFDALVGHLCSASYDHIVIDLPALEGTPATSQLAAVADAALLTVRSGVTTARALRRAQSDLTRTKLLGVTLMDAPTT